MRKRGTSDVRRGRRKGGRIYWLSKCIYCVSLLWSGLNSFRDETTEEAELVSPPIQPGDSSDISIGFLSKPSNLVEGLGTRTRTPTIVICIKMLVYK